MRVINGYNNIATYRSIPEDPHNFCINSLSCVIIINWQLLVDASDKVFRVVTNCLECNIENEAYKSKYQIIHQVHPYFNTTIKVINYFLIQK